MCCRCQDQRSVCNNDFGGDRDFGGDNDLNPKFGGEEEDNPGEEYEDTQGQNPGGQTNTDCQLFGDCLEVSFLDFFICIFNKYSFRKHRLRFWIQVLHVQTL